MTAAELAAVARGQAEAELTAGELAELLASGRYQPDRGLYRGEHWRAEHGAGCLHLRRAPDGRAWLHFDRCDPRRRPALHVLETPELAIPAAVGAAGALAWVIRAVARAWR